MVLDNSRGDTPLDKYRNIGIIAHIDAGKTTVTERILFYTGSSHKIGEVHQGTTTMDWMQQERERGITITSASTLCFWKQHSINIIDTPGHVDFTIEVERSLRVLDGAILVLCAVSHVQTQSETVWKQAKKNKVPSIIFINKMDRIGASFKNTLKDIKEKLHITPLVLFFPWGEEENFQGVIDVINNKALQFHNHSVQIVDLPKELIPQREQYYESILETLAEYNDEIAELYLNNKSINNEQIKKYIRELTLHSKIFPTFCGSAFKNKGIQPLLDAIINFLPKPTFRPFNAFNIAKNNYEDLDVSSNSNAPLIALLFKISYDIHGVLSYLRIYSGNLKKGDKLYNPRIKKVEKVHRILQMYADKKEERQQASAGDIIAIAGIKFSGTGDTLCKGTQIYTLESITPPEPVLSIVIEPKTKQDGEKLEFALENLLREDPTLRLQTSEDTGQKILSGMGELHLEIILDRIEREFKVKPNFGNPQVAYKETISKEAKAEGTFNRIINEKKHFACVQVSLSKKQDDSNSVVFKEKNEIIPQEIIKVIENSCFDCLKAGAKSYPLIGISIVVEKIFYDKESSNEVSFAAATAFAINNALKKTTVLDLEPIMNVELEVDKSFAGEIIGDISSRKGQVKNISTEEIKSFIKASIPMKNLLKYTTVIRSLSKGKATVNIEFSHFEIIKEKQ